LSPKHTNCPISIQKMFEITQTRLRQQGFLSIFMVGAKQ
jgi:hypothetical protein